MKRLIPHRYIGLCFSFAACWTLSAWADRIEVSTGEDAYKIYWALGEEKESEEVIVEEIDGIPIYYMTKTTKTRGALSCTYDPRAVEDENVKMGYTCSLDVPSQTEGTEPTVIQGANEVKCKGETATTIFNALKEPNTQDSEGILSFTTAGNLKCLQYEHTVLWCTFSK